MPLLEDVLALVVLVIVVEGVVLVFVEAVVVRVVGVV